MADVGLLAAFWRFSIPAKPSWLASGPVGPKEKSFGQSKAEVRCAYLYSPLWVKLPKEEDHWSHLCKRRSSKAIGSVCHHVAASTGSFRHVAEFGQIILH